MADEDEGAKVDEAGVPRPGAPPLKRPAAESEWTASDRRGPLEAAEETDVERIVPAYEIDAEGARDPAASSPIETPPAEFESTHAVPEEPAPASAAPVEAETESPERSAPESADFKSDEPETFEAAENPKLVSPEPESVPANPPPPRRTAAWPIAAGVLGGAVIGAAVAAIVFSMQGSGPADGQVTALAARVDSLEKRPDQKDAISALRRSLGELDAKVATLQTLGKTQPTAPAGTPAPAFDPSALQGEVASLKSSIEDLQKQGAATQGLADKLATLETAVAGAQKQASTAQSSAEAVAGQQKSLEGKVGTPALAVVADSLVQRIAQGEPYAAQMDALASLNADPAKVAILRQFADNGVPSAQALSAKFAPLAEPIRETVHKGSPNASFLDRLKSGVTGLVNVRRTDDLSGSDVPAEVARIEADLARGDVGDAVTTWNKLPTDAKAKSDDWGTAAKSSAEAMAAARGLQSDAIVALGTRKS